MQIHRQRIHGNYLARSASDQFSERCGECLVIADPGARRSVMAANPQASPIGQFLFHVVRGGFGLQPQRVAGEVHHLAAVGIVGMMKFCRVGRQSIMRV